MLASALVSINLPLRPFMVIIIIKSGRPWTSYMLSFCKLLHYKCFLFFFNTAVKWHDFKTHHLQRGIHSTVPKNRTAKQTRFFREFCYESLNQNKERIFSPYSPEAKRKLLSGFCTDAGECLKNVQISLWALARTNWLQRSFDNPIFNIGGPHGLKLLSNWFA